MGKRLIQQRRGRGTPTYRAPSFRYAGKATHPKKEGEGIIKEFVHSQGHSAPLMVVQYGNDYNLNLAPEGVRIGDSVSCSNNEVHPGNTVVLQEIPEGTLIYNIEHKPGDGGKFVRSSGVAARVVSKSKDRVVIRLPSKKQKEFPGQCRATIGTVSGSGRTEKPFLKAGTKYHKMRAKNKLYPSVSGTSMNSVDHPFGGTTSSNVGKPTQSGRNAPPGRKVGKIAPRRTGYKR
ncbi:50S ribosomal protein L2 [Candidatus Woesearchaeota archaeon]|nr:50S ribosomal protein L2 [Candidatus Woesearchaeota archaeon]